LSPAFGLGDFEGMDRSDRIFFSTTPPTAFDRPGRARACRVIRSGTMQFFEPGGVIDIA